MGLMGYGSNRLLDPDELCKSQVMACSWCIHLCYKRNDVKRYDHKMFSVPGHRSRGSHVSGWHGSRDIGPG